jgi:hypothetical protein
MVDKVIVMPGERPERRHERQHEMIDTSLSIVRGADDRPRDITYEACRTDWLDGHPMRLQGGFGRVWQIQLQRMTFNYTVFDFGGPVITEARGGAQDWVDSTPGVKVQSAVSAPGTPPDDIVFQWLDGLVLAQYVGPQMPRLPETIRKLRLGQHLQPIIYYDFAATNLRTQFRPTDGRPEPVVEGILFLHHRYEPKPFLIAVQFSVSRNDSPHWEKITVPFSESFFCAVGADGKYSFVTDSGRLYAAPKPAAGQPREVKPLADQPAWRAKVLLRDAKTGGTWVFVQALAAGPSDRDVVVQLAPQADRRPLPAGYLAGLEGKPTPAVLWKCAELLQDKR